MNNNHIFISYRRDDSAGYTRAIYDRLVERFTKERVFMDVDAIEPGLPFDEVINRAVARCEILLAMIGKHWMDQKADAGLRIHDQRDFVRLEIAVALSRNIRVIPVLLDGAIMPTEEALPESIRGLALRNAIEISNTRFDSDVDRLVETVTRVLGGPHAPRNPKVRRARRPSLQWLVGTIAIVVVAAALLFAYQMRFIGEKADRQQSEQPSANSIDDAAQSVGDLERRLKAANILLSTGGPKDRERMMGYFVEPDSAYGLLAMGCLELIGTQRLAKTGFLDMIDKWYTELVGGEEQYAPDGHLDLEMLMEAMVRAQNDYYDDSVVGFEQLLEPKP